MLSELISVKALLTVTVRPGTVGSTTIGLLSDRGAGWYCARAQRTPSTKSWLRPGIRPAMLPASESRNACNGWVEGEQRSLHRRRGLTLVSEASVGHRGRMLAGCTTSPTKTQHRPEHRRRDLGGGRCEGKLLRPDYGMGYRGCIKDLRWDPTSGRKPPSNGQTQC